MLARKGEFEVAAINDLSNAATMAHLLKYDSVHGRYRGDIRVDGETLIVDGQKIKVLSERSPGKLPWAELKVDVALEATGVFTRRESEKGGYGDHLAAGARRVILSAPAKDEPDLTVVQGVNDHLLNAKQTTFSNASCTTNCLAPVVKVLHESFGLLNGLMTTIHAYTNDQRIADMVHSDARRARAAAINIIPTTTGAARAVGKVLPELNGKLNGYAVRVPVADGSLTDLVATLNQKVTVAQVNDALKKAAEGPLKGILEYSNEPLVSSDIIGNPHSSIVDGQLTLVMPGDGGNLVKVVAWYDNEWGYSMRTADLILKAAAL
jgi:glyceraldehyde 3-phosphate dehydrogenase